MELLVIEGVIERNAPTFDLTGHYYESIHIDEKNIHKSSQDIYDEWLRENPLVERIDNPTFFIGVRVKIVTESQRHMRSRNSK
jgi:hypothetical protein